jgi:uncharacterized protein (TIGR02757 family)
MLMPPLGLFLDRLHTKYNQVEYLGSDPLEFAHRYTDPWDQEVVALLGAVLAYGNVKQIRRSVQNVLTRIHSTAESPQAFVRSLAEPSSRKLAAKSMQGFVHRFNRGEDIFLLLELVERSWREHGSVGAHFLKYLEPEHVDITQALNSLIADWRKWASGLEGPTFSYLLTAPRDGSCCKRWCMFLRWMGRKDLLDLGLWTAQSPLAKTFPLGRALRADQLVIPLDTHTGRISQYLGLTHRKSLNWRAALEVTASLRRCHGLDPVRYDFAMSRLGILDLCQKKYRVEICENCDLRTVCKFSKQNRRSRV